VQFLNGKVVLQGDSKVRLLSFSSTRTGKFNKHEKSVLICFSKLHTLFDIDQRYNSFHF
jgi:hypothetical protein